MLWVYILLGIIVVIFLMLVIMYNGLVKSKLKVENAWATIDTQLLRRFDLIPNLVEIVKGYTKHEESTFADIAKCRTQYFAAKTPDEKVNLADDTQKYIKALFGLVESYPELKANTNYLALQNQLTEIESKIALSRQIYNDSVLMNNKAVMSFPQNLVASMFNFTTYKFFEVNVEQKENVQVKF